MNEVLPKVSQNVPTVWTCLDITGHTTWHMLLMDERIYAVQHKQCDRLAVNWFFGTSSINGIINVVFDQRSQQNGSNHIKPIPVVK